MATGSVLGFVGPGRTGGPMAVRFFIPTSTRPWAGAGMGG